jgi:phage terminase large subunit GpA-like protein
MLRKKFPGGHLTLVGANSATGLASRPIRVVLFDEIDKYPPSAGDKGDPIALASNRTKTFWNRKIVLVTTPGVKGASRIEKEWAESDQRRFFVPCPHCGHKQHLRGRSVVRRRRRMLRVGCGALIEERTSRGCSSAANGSRRIRRARSRGSISTRSTRRGRRGKSSSRSSSSRRRARTRFSVFINEDLAELWDPQDGARCSVKGWAPAQESWLILHTRIRKHSTSEDAWKLLEEYRSRTYQHESGATMRLSAFGVDSGDGQTVSYVYAYVRPRQRDITTTWATKGHSQRGKPIINKVGRPNKAGVRVLPIGTDTAKDHIFPRLRQPIPEHGHAYPPGYTHFCQPMPDGADDEYLAQFGREVAKTKFEKGVPYRVYEVDPKGARNEAIDLEVGCLAMLYTLGPAVYDNLGPWVRKVNEEGAKRKAAEATAVAQTPAQPMPLSAPAPAGAPPRRHGGGWVNSWRR